MNTDSQKNLSEILRGTAPGRVQTVGLMQVIPLTSAHSDERFAMPNKMVVSTSDYGTLIFKNPTNKAALIPKDAAYVTKQRAQDHALPHVGFVGAGQEARFDDAACIQDSQTGMIKAEAHELIILPFLLREAALMSHDKKSYDKLWGVIRDMNQAMGLRASGHVDVYLEQFGQQLARFVAEFETVPQQVGAIVLINGSVAGIERVPSYDYWLDVWPTLIRESYGSLALYAQRKEEEPRPLSTRMRLSRDVGSVTNLIRMVQDTMTAEQEATRQIVRGLMSEQVTTKQESSTALGLTVETLISRHFVGQCVREGLQVVYASMVATKGRLMARPETMAAFAV